MELRAQHGGHIIDGPLDIVGADGDMAVGASAMGIQHLRDRAREAAAAAHLHRQTEQECQAVHSLVGLFLALRIDADMHQLEAQHGLDGLSGELFNLVPLSRVNQVAGHHPGAAAGNDLVKIKIRGQILCIDAAGRHELHVHIGRRHGLDLGKSPGLLRREKLHHVQSQLNGLLNIGRAGSAGSDGHSFLDTVLHRPGIQSGADDELGSGRHCRVHLLRVQHRACTYAHVREVGSHDPYGLRRRVRAESHLRAGKPSRAQGLCQGQRILRPVDLYDRNNTDFADLL